MRFIISLIIPVFLVSCNSKVQSSKVSSTNATQLSTDTDLRQINYMSDYSLSSQYGTKVDVTINDGKRKIVSNAIPNHPTGQFPNPGNPNTISKQDKIWEFPTTPTLASEPKWAREPGVAINGIKFEPETAERFVCETGEVYRIEAMEGFLDFGLDENHAHVQPTGEYHYHGVPTELISLLDKGDDLIHVGFAADGYSIYYSKSAKYKPSYVLSEEKRTGDVCAYKRPNFSKEEDVNGTNPDGVFVSDWVYDSTVGDLDECNGIIVNGEYAYFITDDYPFITRCLKGVFSERGPRGGGGRGPRGGRRGEGRPTGDHDHRGNDHRH